MKNYKILLIFYISNFLLVVGLAINFVEFTGINISDYYYFINIAQKIRAGDFPYIPFYYSRSLIYLLLDINKYPPSFIDIILIVAVNQLLILIVVNLIVDLLLKIYNFNISKNLLILILYFYPGLIFLSATFRQEIFALLFLYVTLYYIYISRKNIFVLILFMMSTLTRPSGPIAALLVIANLNCFTYQNKIIDLLTFYIKNVVFMIAVILIIEYNIPYYFQSGWYNLKIYNDPIRDFFNVTNHFEILNIFVKIPIAYVLDSFSFNTFYSAYQNTENINNITASIRCIIFISLFYKIIFMKNKNIYTNIKIYMLLTIPNIVLIGFYQTRYFIIFDLLILASCFIKNYKCKNA